MRFNNLQLWLFSIFCHLPSIDKFADVFILINSLINTYTTWQDNVKVLKIGAVICSVFLILYDIFVGAYVYVISELLYGGAALLSILYKQKNKAPKKIDTNLDESQQESDRDKNSIN